MEILIRGLNLERWSILQENQAHLILNTINWKTGVSPTKNSTVLLHAHFNPRFRKELQYHVPRFLGQHTDAFPFNSQLIVRALKTFMTQVSTLTKISTILSPLSSQSGLAGLYSPPSRAGDSLFPLRRVGLSQRGKKNTDTDILKQASHCPLPHSEVRHLTQSIPNIKL